MLDRPDVFYMKRAIHLAFRGRGKTSPNPMVGAVIVKEGEVIGEGYHPAPGKPHAEVLALLKAGNRSKGATLYTNLEPCCHKNKRTPPCTTDIIQHGIARVVSAMKDPNPQVLGKGFETLRNAGIEVTEHVMCSEAKELNQAFIKHTTTGRPYVTLKAAMTLDGKIATASGASRWITGEKSIKEVHRLRADVDAVMVGIGTVLADNPMLTLRNIRGENPLRIVIDPLLKISLHSKILTTLNLAPALLLTTPKAPSEKVLQIEKIGASVILLPEKKGVIPFDVILDYLGKIKIMSLLVEGGAILNGILLRAGWVDRMIIYIAPKLLCGGDAKGVISGAAFSDLSSAIFLDDVNTRRIGEDIRVEGRPQNRKKSFEVTLDTTSRGIK
ncbi:MAG: bifunctional diaminohydroxyphosphoribosylaminopyrimidine deaminase/5-amino-6-(5-phosphoribosylamino)uracil reductase RibD [Nitrospiria bacterium]